jgi:hypothetical protein
MLEELETQAQGAPDDTQAPSQEDIARGQENDDLWVNEDVESYFGNAYHGKAKVEQQYHQYMSRVLKMFNDDKVRDGIIRALHVDNPVNAVTELALGVVGKVDQAMQKTGEVMSDEVRMYCGNEVVGRICQIGENANVAFLEDDEKEVAFVEATRKHLAAKIQSGEVDAEKLANVNGASVEGMTMEQRKDLHRRLIELDAKSRRVGEKYGMGQGVPLESTPGNPKPMVEEEARKENPISHADSSLLGGII